jgi:hypothetical protein
MSERCAGDRRFDGLRPPKPFNLIFERVKNEEWRALRDDFRTFLDESVINEEPAAERALIWAGALLQKI